MRRPTQVLEWLEGASRSTVELLAIAPLLVVALLAEALDLGATTVLVLVIALIGPLAVLVLLSDLIPSRRRRSDEQRRQRRLGNYRRS